MIPSRLRAASAITAAALCAACGYMGPPLPPALNLPNRVTDLSAVQRGSKIVMRFTMSKLTTEALPVPDPPEIDLRVGASGPRFDERDWLIHSTRVTADTVRPEYEIPSGQFVNHDVAIAVKLINAKGKDAGWSNFVQLHIVPALGRPENLHAAATAQGVALTWEGGNSPLYRVYRKGPIGEFEPLGESQGRTYLDVTAEFGKPYSYFVQGAQKSGTVESQSEASDTVSITPQDVFPPATPANLKAIIGTRSVELSWDRNTESDLAGYQLYRSVGDGPFEALGGKLPGASYSDRAVKSGRYRYSVTAIDTLGNESPRSSPIDVVFP